MENNNPSETLTPLEQQSSTGVPVEVTPADSLSSTEADKAGENDIQKKYSEEWFKNIEEKVKNLQIAVDNMSGFNDAILAISKSLDEAKQQQDNLKKELDNESKRHTKESVEILGIFITLFTFISVSTSIVLQLKTVFHAAFVLMVLLTGLMTFLYLFHHLLHHEHKPLEEMQYEQGKSRIITFIKHQWKTGNLCYIIPAILAVCLGFISWLFGPEISDPKKPTNVNYIQNMPTSKIRLDGNIEQYAIGDYTNVPPKKQPNISK